MTAQRASHRNRAVRLADGRRLAYAEYGDPDGTPVLYFHGMPGSRLDVDFAAPVAASLGVRLLAPDRPGIGLSDFQPDRTLLDWPADMQALADALDLTRFGLLGWSGGGPYVLACAFAIPERILSAAVASSAGPLDAPGALREMGTIGRTLLWLAGHAPPLARALVAVQVWATKRWPDRAFQGFLSSLPPSDRRALTAQGPPRKVMRFVVESARRGSRGPVQDYRILSRPWGFRPEATGIPIHMWHGDADEQVSLDLARNLAGRIPRAGLRICPGEGHFLFAAHMEEMLRAVLSG